MSTPFQLLLAALGGGGVWKTIEWAIDYAGLQSDAAADFRDDLLARVKALQQRVDQLESDLRDEQRARVQAELHNEIMDERIRRLVSELNRLREEQNMAPLDPEDYQVSSIPLNQDPTPES